MELRHRLFANRICLVFLSLSLGHAQILAPRPNGTPNPGQELPLRKSIIERHFESIKPRVRAQFGGAVPGAALLAHHPARTAETRNRLAALHSVAEPEGSGSSTMPGILVRPALDAGELPTSVATGDFNGDGHMDFVVANGITNDLWIYLGK